MNTLKILKRSTILLLACLVLPTPESSSAAALLQIRPVIADVIEDGLGQPPPPGVERMELLKTNTRGREARPSCLLTPTVALPNP
jgi:hypothetical protein